MNNTSLKLAFAYLRLSNEERNAGESSSISSQRLLIEQYCSRNNILLVRTFADDGWSGGNFDRPDFKEMIKQLLDGKANMVITKDLSRLGRDMVEASYYAEQFFPEHGIHYIAINDNFDNSTDNVMAPFQFAMNEVYLRDGSRKVKEVLKSKRESGQYCACPPYGYKKNPEDPHSLIPDDMTAPVVLRIFQAAADGRSSRQIAMDLNDDGVIPPLKYRVLYRDSFSEAGASHASDMWNYTTVKRILKNRVYLGHTLLGKSRKVSVKSDKKIALPKETWVVHENTHPSIVSEEVFRLAQENLGKGSRDYREYDHVRKSIFSGIAVCSRCGHSLCSCGTVYKGERIKYWYLSCTHQRPDIPDSCEGVRIRYTDLMEVVKQDLNSLLNLNDAEVAALVESAIQKSESAYSAEKAQQERKRSEIRLKQIDQIVTKLYMDNAGGLLSDERLHTMVQKLEGEAHLLKRKLIELSGPSPSDQLAARYERFFAMAKRYTQIEKLDRETLCTFVDRIEVSPKQFADGLVKATHRNTPFTQEIKIFYKFIGAVEDVPAREFPRAESA